MFFGKIYKSYKQKNRLIKKDKPIYNFKNIFLSVLFKYCQRLRYLLS